MVREQAAKVGDKARGAWYGAGRVAMAIVASVPAAAAFVEGANAITRLFTGEEAFPMAGYHLDETFDPMLDRSFLEQGVGLVGEAWAAAVTAADAGSEWGEDASGVIASHLPDGAADVVEVGVQVLVDAAIAVVAGGVALKLAQKFVFRS